MSGCWQAFGSEMIGRQPKQTKDLNINTVIYEKNNAVMISKLRWILAISEVARLDVTLAIYNWFHDPIDNAIYNLAVYHDCILSILNINNDCNYRCLKNTYIFFKIKPISSIESHSLSDLDRGIKMFHRWRSYWLTTVLKYIPNYVSSPTL